MADQIASLYAKVGANTSDFEKKMKGVDKTLNDSGRKVGGFGNIMKLGFAGAMAGGAAAIGGLGMAMKSSIDQAAEMEQGIADIAAAMGTSADETTALKGLIRDLGLDPNLKVGATEAAAAIGVLGTAGLSVTEILDGAARSTVLLSNATGSDMAAAAATASDVMAIFGIEAKDMDTAVNGILGTTQASKFSFEDYALALAQGGGVAATVGVEFEDFNATIAAISPLFASGSDAGTSLKTMLLNLVPKSNEAEDAMRTLGLITEDGSNKFFTATGELKSMGEIAGILNTAMAGLSEEQKNQALSTIFGTDAMRAAAAMAGLTEEEFIALKATIGKTDAEQAAATRMDTLSGKWDIFKGILDQTAIDIGTAVMPQMRDLLDVLIKLATDNGPQIVAFFMLVASKVVEMVNNFAAYWPRISETVTTAAGKIGEDVGRILGSLGEIVSWFQGDGATAETAWGNFWLSVLDMTGKAVGSLADMIANIVEAFALLGNAFQALGAGDWGKLNEIDQRMRQINSMIDLFKSPIYYGLGAVDQRAEGGPVQGGQPYLVGEHGPEMFTPRSSGYVHDAAATASWGGERTLRVVVESPLPSNRQAIRELALALKREIDLTGAVMVR